MRLTSMTLIVDSPELTVTVDDSKGVTICHPFLKKTVRVYYWAEELVVEGDFVTKRREMPPTRMDDS